MTGRYAPEKLPEEIEAKLISMSARQPFGGIITISAMPELARLVRFVDYEGAEFSAIRKVCDQLDQVTYWRNRQA